MKNTCKFSAFDFGASLGRAMLAISDGEKLILEEKHRFSSDPVNINGLTKITSFWGIPIITAIQEQRKCTKKHLKKHL